MSLDPRLFRVEYRMILILKANKSILIMDSHDPRNINSLAIINVKENVVAYTNYAIESIL